jgi:hypothetical protein
MLGSAVWTVEMVLLQKTLSMSSALFISSVYSMGYEVTCVVFLRVLIFV